MMAGRATGAMPDARRGSRLPVFAAGVMAGLLASLALAPALAAAGGGEWASLQVRPGEGGTVVLVGNPGVAPVEVGLSAAGAVDSDPPLPLRRVIAPGRTEVLAVIAGPAPDLRLDAVPGEPFALAEDVVYSLPVEESRAVQGQGFHGGFSHQDAANRYALDLEAPEGTPVLAARGGVVIQAQDGFTEGGVDPSLADRANLVRVLHEDGSMALYAHLQAGSVQVRTGDPVHLGQQLGAVGTTGYSSGPHLHFAVQVNAGLRLESVPFRMIGPTGYLHL